jgi:hypothetical protein
VRVPLICRWCGSCLTHNMPPVQRDPVQDLCVPVLFQNKWLKGDQDNKAKVLLFSFCTVCVRGTSWPIR